MYVECQKILVDFFSQPQTGPYCADWTEEIYKHWQLYNNLYCLSKLVLLHLDNVVYYNNCNILFSLITLCNIIYCFMFFQINCDSPQLFRYFALC